MDLKNKKIFLYENINEIDINTRRELLQILYNNINIDNIIEKGNGVQIKFDNIDESNINILYNILYKKIDENKLEIEI